MSFSAEFLFAAAIAVAAFLVGVLLVRSRATRTRTRRVGQKPPTPAAQPKNLRYKCVGCGGRFTHSRRTLGAWQRGERNFHCKACMTKASSPKAAKVKTGPRP